VLVISVRIQWFPSPDGRGALRLRDGEIWYGARWCQRCNLLGYDHADVDDVLEAHRLGVDLAPLVADCEACGELVCVPCRPKCKGCLP